MVLSIIGKGVLNFVAFSPEMEGLLSKPLIMGKARMETQHSHPATGVMCRGRKETPINVNLQQKLRPRIFFSNPVFFL
jgi:hypothetical protein